jgi:hypothetical protein
MTKLQTLLKAVEQTIVHLNTTLELDKHIQPCFCYGCNLKKAYFDLQVTAFSCGPKEDE